jgi:hypothetical protein
MGTDVVQGCRRSIGVQDRYRNTGKQWYSCRGCSYRGTCDVKWYRSSTGVHGYMSTTGFQWYRSN